MPYPGPGALRILLVDDDSQLLRTLGDILGLHGHHVLKARGAHEALALVREDGPEVAVVELRLPDMSGAELIERLHETSPLTQAIVLTGNASLDSAVGALRQRVFDYLLKPVAPSTLLGTVARAGERWRLHKTEQALRHSETRSRLLLETISDLVIAVDSARIIHHAGPSITRMLGFAPDEVIGSNWDEFVHPEDAAAAYRQLTFNDRVEAPAITHTLRVRHAHGGWRLLEITAARFAGDSGWTGVLVTGRDVTDRERLTAELQRAQTLDSIGRMAGGVAHDFNNILTAILGFSELLLDQADSNGLEREDLMTIQRAAEHGASLSRQLLAFSRRQLLDPKTLDLRALIDGMTPVLTRVLGKHIEFVVRHDGTSAYVKADPTQLEQVIMNLVVNARDAMSDGGTFTLETGSGVVAASQAVEQSGRRAGAYATLVARDTGCGMPPNVLARVFEPFFTTKSPDKGIGLGLPSVYGIVQQSGGHIDVVSEVGHGTTFTIHLPSVAQDPGCDGTDPEPAPRARATVLVVEDRADVRTLMARTLEDMGHAVLIACTAEAGLLILQDGDQSIDLLITDVVLPGLSGPALAREAVILRPGLRVLFVSGYSDDAVLRHGVLASRDAFLQKPFGPQALARKVGEVLMAATTAA